MERLWTASTTCTGKSVVVWSKSRESEHKIFISSINEKPFVYPSKKPFLSSLKGTIFQAGLNRYNVELFYILVLHFCSLNQPSGTMRIYSICGLVEIWVEESSRLLQELTNHTVVKATMERRQRSMYAWECHNNHSLKWCHSIRQAFVWVNFPITTVIITCIFGLIEKLL